MIRIAVTGAGGFLGWHALTRLHAANCAARFSGGSDVFDIVAVDRAAFAHKGGLADRLKGVDAVLHFAGVNRGSGEAVGEGNPQLALDLVDACTASGVRPHIVYANSVHAQFDTLYGRSKRRAGEILSAFTNRYTDLVLPHLFGEGARPFYNNVTATFIRNVLDGNRPDINPEGRVSLLHAGEAVRLAIDAVRSGTAERIAPMGRDIAVPKLWEKFEEFHRSYQGGTFPALQEPFDVALFNSYRCALYPDGFPRPVKLNADVRGQLFEAVKGGGGGQTFLSWTEPGMTRGDHFHLAKVERFLVLEGEAVIRVRKVLGDAVWTYPVSGAAPAVVDMPTLHTHSIENTGNRPLLTLFWANEIFDPGNPDTFADPVLGG